jgi:hypothetical protein
MLSVYPPINFRMAELVVMKLGTWAHLNGVRHKYLPSICVSIYVSPIVAMQRLGENVTAAKNTHATIGELFFLCGPYRIKGK